MSYSFLNVTMAQWLTVTWQKGFLGSIPGRSRTLLCAVCICSPCLCFLQVLRFTHRQNMSVRSTCAELIRVGTCRGYWWKFTVANRAACMLCPPSAPADNFAVCEYTEQYNWSTTGLSTGWCYEHRHNVVKISSISRTSTTVTMQKWWLYRP